MSHPPADAVLTPDELAEAGRLLFGEQWQKQLARALNVSERSMRYLAAGERPFHIGLAKDLLALTRARGKQIDAIAEKIAAKGGAAIARDMATTGRVSRPLAPKR